MTDTLTIRTLSLKGGADLHRLADPACLWEQSAPDDDSDGAVFVRAIQTLCEAFSNYPATRYIVGEDRVDSDARLLRLSHFFGMARVYRDEPILVAAQDGAVAGVALISWVEERNDVDALHQLRADLWRVLGTKARARYEKFGETLDTFTTDHPQIHLNMIGVRNVARGRGVGRALLDRVHAFAEARPNCDGVSLNTELPENVSLYRHFGYEVVAQAQVSPELTSWGMFRSNVQ